MWYLSPLQGPKFCSPHKYIIHDFFGELGGATAPLALPLIPGSFSVLDSFLGSPNIFLIALREAIDDRNVPIGIDSIANLLGNGLHGLEIVVGGGGEAGLDDVDAELGELDAYDEVFYFVFKTHVMRLFFFFFLV